MPLPKIIDPSVNDNRNIVPLEDLVIFMELKAFLPFRSIVRNANRIGNIVDGVTTLNNVSDGQEVSFTFPFSTKYGESNRPALTTNWTEIGGDSKTNTTEGFGITNIDIQYDASFVPRVSIDFIDIRGKALFEPSEHSQYYSAFFHLPYPLYILQFKGYYGDDVTYPLHLMKFNSRFNGETGNFEIKCDFIGHTFALLSDLLLGFALAAPDITSGGDPGCCTTGRISIKEYIEKAKKVTNQTEQLKDSSAMKKLGKTGDLKRAIDNDLPKKLKNKEDLETKPPTSFTGTTYNFVENNLYDVTSERNRSINLFLKQNILGEHEVSTEERDFINNRLILKKNGGGSHPIYKLDGKNIIVDGDGKKVVSWKLYRDLIPKLSSIIDKRIQQESLAVSSSTNKILQDNEFAQEVKIQPTVETLLCGFEIFLNKLKNVSEEAANPQTREERNELFEIEEKLTIPIEALGTRDKKEVYPWPLYYENDASNGGPVLKFPGVNPKLSQIPEVVFVLDFIQALFTIREDLNAEAELLNAGEGWVPVNMLESPLISSVTNPFSNLTELETKKTLFSRALVNLSYTYPLGTAIGTREDNDGFPYEDTSAGSDTGEVVPDPIGNYAISAVKAWWDAWEFWNDDMGEMVKLLAEAEATVFYDATTSDKIIDNLLDLNSTGIIDEISKISTAGANDEGKFNPIDGNPINVDENGNKTYIAIAPTGLVANKCQMPSGNKSNWTFDPSNLKVENGLMIVGGVIVASTAFIPGVNLIGASIGGAVLLSGAILTYTAEDDNFNNTSVYYAVNSPTTNPNNSVDISVMQNTSLTINGTKMLYGSFNNGVVFEFKSRSVVEDPATAAPKNNEELATIWEHWYAIDDGQDFPKYTTTWERRTSTQSPNSNGDRIKMNTFNMLGNTNYNNGDDNELMAWMPGKTYTANNTALLQGSDGKRKDYWRYKMLQNIKLESTDIGDGEDHQNPAFKNKSETFMISYGSFPLYIGTQDVPPSSFPRKHRNTLRGYYGEIQDTYFYKLNNELTETFSFQDQTYPLKDTNTAYLFLNTLSIEYINPFYLRMFAQVSGMMKVPVPWILWVGAILWRRDYIDSLTNNAADPIQYGNVALAGVTGSKNLLTDFTDTTTPSRKDLGIHWDYLRNNNKYRDDSTGNVNFTEYKKKPVVAPDHLTAVLDNDIFDSHMAYQTPYEDQTTNPGGGITYPSCNSTDLNITDRTFLYTLFSLPDEIKNEFKKQFLEWSKNGTVESITSWSHIKTIIEDKKRIKRHFFQMDLRKLPGRDLFWGIGSSGNVASELINGKGTAYDDLPKSGAFNVPFYDNVGTIGYDYGTDTTNSDEFSKAYYNSGWFNGIFPDLNAQGTTDRWGVFTGFTINSTGYVFNSTGNPPVLTTVLPYYAQRIRFLDDESTNFLDLSQSYMYMMNGSWRNFILRDGKSTGSAYAFAPINQTFPTFYATLGTLKTYFDAFIEKLRAIKEKKKEEKETPPKNYLEDNDLKLDIYLKFKNLYDKWISTTLLEENNKICLSKYFKYKDRAMRDIGTKAVINPKSVTQLFDKSDNSLYNILYELLSQNNFDFFPLPHFNGFGSDNDKISDMFKIKLTVAETKFKPSFVCIYVGDRASTVDFANSEFGNNVIDFDDPTMVPGDINSPDANVAVFRIQFGLENQNLFKSISLDQADYKETSESLQVIDDLSKSGKEGNAVSFKGMNLLSVYNKRSYNCEVQMLGCAVIEPMTYFQLSNVPMFKGAYMIHKVSHNITPNHMTTSFTGVRIPFSNIPIITDYAVAIGLLDNVLSGGGTTDNTIDGAGLSSFTGRIQSINGPTVADGVSKITKCFAKNSAGDCIDSKVVDTIPWKIVRGDRDGSGNKIKAKVRNTDKPLT